MNDASFFQQILLNRGANNAAGLVKLNLDELRTMKKEQKTRRPNSVEASGPYGKIIAGSMELFKDFDNKTSQVSGNLNFSDGVTLIYLPSTVK